MMSNVIGIDIGGSTTKIVGFRKDDRLSELIEPLFVRATDPITSLYGAFGKFTSLNNLSLDSISNILVTGVGASSLKQPIYNLPCKKVSEFESIGLGGLYLSGLESCITVSMGTGTAIVYSEKGKSMEYLGGTGVGGGTLQGLSKLLLGMDDLTHIHNLAKEGDLSNIDLKIKEISNTDSFPSEKLEMTASNFGRVSDIASKSDIALGGFNLVYETVAMMSIFAARSKNTKNIVLTGNLTGFDVCRSIFDTLAKMFDVNFIIPKYSQFGTVIGAALQDK